jgi:hypothetical protein
MNTILRYVVLLTLGFALVLAGCQKKTETAAPAASAAPAAPATPGFKQASAAGVTMEWKITGPNIEIKLRAQTTGWIGVAFDPQSLMKGANFIIGYVKDGQVSVQDHFGNQLTGHAPDTELGGKDDVTNVSGKEENGVTEIGFTIPLASGDQYDKPLGAGRHVVLLAHGAADDFETPHEPDGRAKISVEL